MLDSQSFWVTGARIWTEFYSTGNGEEPLQVFEQGCDMNKLLSRR